MKLKPGVKLAGLSPQMALAAVIVQSVYGSASCTITSANDGKHSEKSLHYVGNALDFRTKDFFGDKTMLVSAIRSALGSEFDVVFEDEGGVQEHVHVEYDVKGD